MISGIKPLRMIFGEVLFMADFWWVWALVSGIVTAVYVFCNQLLKMPTAMFLVYRGVGLSLFMLPFSFAFSFNPGWQFWALCFITGIMISYNDNRFFNTVANYGAEISSSLQPLCIGVTFFLWLALKPEQIIEYWHSPLRFFLILLCLTGFTFAILLIRRTPANYQALKFLLPSLFLTAFVDGFQKLIMEYGITNISAASFYYIMLTSFFAGLGNLWVFIRCEHNSLKLLLLPRNLFLGMSLVSLAGIAVAFKNFGMAYTPNPAYVSALIFLNPVWIMMTNNIYLHFKKYTGYQRINRYLLLLLLSSVIGLIIFGRG